jgi:hypothetical protein
VNEERIARTVVEAHTHPSGDTHPDVHAYALAAVVPELIAEIERLRQVNLGAVSVIASIVDLDGSDYD